MRGYHFVAGEEMTAEKLNRGELVECAVITTNASTTASTTEVAVITTSSITLEDGRAYEFILRGLISHASTNLTDIVQFRLRRTSSTGTFIRSLGNMPVTNRGTANRNHLVDMSHIGVNDTGSDITDVIVATYSWDTGSSATFTFAASAAQPATLSIYDLGPSSEYAGIGAIE